MDPSSIVGLVAASLDLAIKCASTLKRLNTIASQYKNARLTILSMVQNLDSLQLAWNRISVWSKSYVPDQNAAENGLIERLERFLETGALVMEALDEDLSTYDPDNLSLTDRSRLIWNGQGLQDHQNRLRDQATSMTLLLQAIQLPTIQETNEMLRNAQKQFQKSDESAYSIVPSRMSSRLSTSTRQSLSIDDNFSYHRLSFENDLFTARVYKRSYRTPLIQRLFRRSKSADTEEHLIYGDEADRQIVSPPSDGGHVPSYYSLDDGYGVNYRGVEGSAPQPWPKMSSEYAEVTRQMPSDLQRGYDEFYRARLKAVDDVGRRSAAVHQSGSEESPSPPTASRRHQRRTRSLSPRSRYEEEKRATRERERQEHADSLVRAARLEQEQEAHVRAVRLAEDERRNRRLEFGERRPIESVERARRRQQREEEERYRRREEVRRCQEEEDRYRRRDEAQRRGEEEEEEEERYRRREEARRRTRRALLSN